jgi:quercetin dioxygenase-like cupin family protein
MKLKKRILSQEPGEPMPGEGHHKVNSVMAVNKRELSAYSCRILRIQPGGSTATHTHPREHVVLALTGEATVETDTETTEITPGTIIDIPPDTPHRFTNTTTKKTALLIQNLYPKNENT